MERMVHSKRTRYLTRYLFITAVLVAGMLAFGLSVLAAQAAPTAEEDPPEPESGLVLEPRDDNYFCGESEELEFEHPVAARLAEVYDLSYEEVIGWFCEGYGFGQIALALHTAAATGDTPEALLTERLEYGWGQIWQEAELIGRAAHAGPPDHAGVPGPPDHAGRPDHAGPPDEVDGEPDEAEALDGGGGPPAHAGPPNGGGGPPDHVGPSNNGGGPPDHAGPPNGGGGRPGRNG